MRFSLVVSLTLTVLPACSATSLVIDGSSGRAVRLEHVVDDVVTAGVVFLGEDHDNRVGHALQLEMVEMLHSRRPDLAISLEMLERDVQDDLDRYLSGQITEKNFLKLSRPWKNYAPHYRPIVEFARAKGLPVIAANAPKSIASRVAREGISASANSPHIAQKTSAPRDAYWEAFKKAILEPSEGEESGHGAALDDEALYRLYQAQCLKDDTMAESIVQILTASSDQPRSPLVVHLCGRFHSDQRMGAVERLQQRLPDLKIAVLSMEAVAVVAPPGPDFEFGGDYVLFVREGPKPPEPKGNPHARATDPHAKAGEGVGAQEEQGGDRPALGFMPAYSVEGGVGVEFTREDGPAEKAGIKAGDVIIGLARLKIADIEDYSAVLSTLKPGQKVRVVVDRDGKKMKFRVVLGVR